VDPFVPTADNRSTPLAVEAPTPPEAPAAPDVGISIESENGALSNTVLIILLLTVGAAAPSILLLTTSFTRFIIVLGLTRNALGTQSIPPNQVLTGIALFLTLFVMAPVLTQINDDALQPLLAGEMTQGEAFDAGFAPLREFMLAQTDEDDLTMLLDLRGEEPQSPEEVSATVLVPAFVLSELKSAFIIGFMIFIPFLIVDLVVSSVLMSMGMMMLPPVFVSLPLKLLLFVMVDGWGLIIGSVVESINGV
jgi:flagellar biosynthetic protein FliP